VATLRASGPLNGPESAAEPRLDLHEGIPDPEANRCRRWPEHFRLLNEKTGELFPGKCKATNLCPYCARAFAVETSEMLILDAMEDSPSVYIVLTARELLSRHDCGRHLEQLRKKLRRTWPSIRWAVLVEFQKRGALHLNLIVKGVPSLDVDELHEQVYELWCSRVDAEPEAQYVGLIADRLGVVKYVTLHFMKQSQAPVLGWRGHRYSSTRDYLVRPAAIMREEARASLREKRMLHRAVNVAYDAGDHQLSSDIVEIVYEQLSAEARDTTYSFRRIRPGTPVAQGTPGHSRHGSGEAVQSNGKPRE
jgi:hypothetical protein